MESASVIHSARPPIGWERELEAEPHPRDYKTPFFFFFVLSSLLSPTHYTGTVYCGIFALALRQPSTR